MIKEITPFNLMSLLNSASEIRPKTKNKPINACSEYKASINRDTYKIPENALTSNSFIYKSSNSSEYRFFELLP